MKPTTANTPSTPCMPPTGVEELLAAGKALGTPMLPPEGYRPFVVVPHHYDVAWLDLAPLKPLPDHIRQAVTLEDAESFILYVKAFRTPTARLLASAVKLANVSPTNAGGACFTALLDYHEGGREDAPEGNTTATGVAQIMTKARRVAHVAKYPVPLALEFSTWLGSNGKALPQMEFVTFIEANCADVVSPESAILMELALNFESKMSVSFQSKVDRVTGGRNLTFQEVVDASGAPSVDQMKVPEWLTVMLPVFDGGKSYEFRARLEYRPANGRLTIAYHLQRPHQVFRKAWNDLRAEIATALEVEILTGSTDVQRGWDEMDS